MAAAAAAMVEANSRRQQKRLLSPPPGSPTPSQAARALATGTGTVQYSLLWIRIGLCGSGFGIRIHEQEKIKKKCTFPELFKHFYS
jgi:hypothetical protein